MKYNLFKNCRVVINAGTEVLKIDGMGAPARETPVQEMAGVNIQRTYEDYSVFMANLDGVKVGDRVKLPSFTVPAVKMDGEEVMSFDEKHINADEAIVIGKDENGDLILIFEHCLFESAIDLNNEKRFEMTQLGQYLQSEFLRAMNGAGIPAESCGLISEEEMFGDNALEYFKTGRNRIAFDFDEDCSRYYWLSTLYDAEASAAYFCFVCGDGSADCGGAGDAYTYVRPRFIIHKSIKSAGLYAPKPTGVAEMEIEKIINGLKTAKDKIEKEINFLQSVDITSGAECCELYIKENGLEFIADEIREAYHAGFIKAYRQRLEK